MDNILFKLIDAEIKRQQETLDLIPSENIVSPDVLRALGSPLTNKYSEGYPGKRYYGGHEVIDKIEIITQERARKAFKLKSNWHVNVQPYSGSPANMAIYYALLKPGDTIMGLSLPFGGHLTHGWKVSASGTLYRSAQYTLNKRGFLDYKAIRDLAEKEKPALIVAGATAYSRKINFKKFGEIARDVGAYFLADISHIAGLVVGGVHPSPFPYADLVMTTTHKTLRGPRGAIIFANKNSRIAKARGVMIAEAIDKAIFPALQGGPHDHQTAAIAVALEEAQKADFKVYAKQVVRNAKVFAESLQKFGFKIVSGGTDTHLFLVDLTRNDMTGKEAEELLGEIGIIVNRNAVPYDSRSPFNPSGIRLGTPSATTRGMKEKEMRQIALLIHQTINGEPSIKEFRENIRNLCRHFPLPY